MKEKPLDLHRLSERDLVLKLADANNDLRWGAFQELGARGENRGWKAYGLLTQDPELARLFLSPKDPFDAVGVVVGPGTYERIRTAWSGGPEQDLSGGGKEFTLDFRNLRLDVISLGATFGPLEGDTPEGREGLGEVEFRVVDVAAFAARVENLEGDLRGRIILLPSDPAGVPSGSSPPARFLLAHIRSSRSVQSVLVQLIQG
ncbi:MAG: hypothetical protein JNK54_04070 [Elusimicrobia bacterium]|nr:hypothetical protein [Elusimicrobiota bacterium]